VYIEPFGLSPDTEKLLASLGYRLDLADASWGEAAGILVGGKSLAEIEKGGGARYNGAIDSRAASGEAIGY
ncbi:MAG: gamma-glutamyltransferase, partial [Mesorhizobium sp.]